MYVHTSKCDYYESLISFAKSRDYGTVVQLKKKESVIDSSAEGTLITASKYPIVVL